MMTLSNLFTWVLFQLLDTCSVDPMVLQSFDLNIWEEQLV
jgi:hypothetical protein